MTIWQNILVAILVVTVLGTRPFLDGSRVDNSAPSANIVLDLLKR